MLNGVSANKFKSLHFEVTHFCNLRCSHCYNIGYIKSPTEDLKLNDVKRVIDISKELGCQSFGLSGGEPFMRKDIMQILEYLSNDPIHILTNGLLIKENELKRINENSYLIEFRVSLDGLDSNKKIRNTDYLRVINKIKLLIQYEFVVTVNTMITPYNLGELKSMYHLMSQLGVDRWRLDFIYNYGNAAVNTFQIDRRQTFEVVKDVISLYLKDRPSFELDVNKFFRSFCLENAEPMEYDLDTKPCEYQASLVVRPNGDVSFCPSLNLTFGNILKNSLEEIFDSSDWLNFSNLKVRDLDDKCLDCKMLKNCGGGCRADAFYETGSLYKHCDFTCEAVGYYCTQVLPMLKQLKIF